MGLLERASSAAGRPGAAPQVGDGDAQAMSREAAPSPGAMGRGLLRRSLELLGGGGSEEQGAAAPLPEVPAHEVSLTADQVTAELLEQARRLPEKVELPSRLFALLADRLGIVKGALLLYDPHRMVYAPWASVGFDATTHRRLRIPQTGCDAFAAVANGEPVAVSDQAGLAQFQKFFSTREFGALQRVLLAPFAAGGKLAGALLVTEANPPFDQAGLLGCLARVATASGPSIQRVRAGVVAGQADERSIGSESRGQFQRWLSNAAAEGKRLLVFDCSLEAWEQRVLAANRYLDPFRLEQDLRSIVDTFAAGLGGSTHLGGGRFLVAASGLAPEDLDLFSHQLAGLLSGLFAEAQAEPSDVALGEPRAFPEGAASASALLAELAQPPKADNATA